mgnify:CR=1 FL=1
MRRTYYIGLNNGYQPKKRKQTTYDLTPPNQVSSVHPANNQNKGIKCNDLFPYDIIKEEIAHLETEKCGIEKRLDELKTNIVSIVKNVDDYGLYTTLKQAYNYTYRTWKRNNSFVKSAFYLLFGENAKYVRISDVISVDFDTAFILEFYVGVHRYQIFAPDFKSASAQMWDFYEFVLKEFTDEIWSVIEKNCNFVAFRNHINKQIFPGT